MNTSVSFSLPFYLVCITILSAGFWAWHGRRKGWGLPTLVVLATVSVWYVGDVLYNDYNLYVAQFGTTLLDNAWWQVMIFILSFILCVPGLNGAFNRDIAFRGSMMMRYFETRRLEHPDVQRRITHAGNGLFIAWAILMTIALLRTNFDVIGLFAPYLGVKSDPWGRNRVGGGIDAILALAAYVQVFIAAGAGVLAAVARNPRTRSIAVIICLLTFPYYIFDRTRNTMLATVLPGLLAWVFLRLRGGMVVKCAVLAASFLVVNAWFSFVMANRSDGTIAAAVNSEESRTERKGRHEGLNMFEELGWINYFMEKGTYKPNGGARYFAELVNPIPRVLWKDKPQIGIDYAIARGQGGGNDASGGVFATISTGMIGQGVVNFGVIVGPVAAAILMAAWVALVARQDLLGEDPARLLLYAIGLILTFNVGRDITFLVLYPFLFGLLMLKVYYHLKPPAAMVPAGPRRRRPGRVKPKREVDRSWREDIPVKDDDKTEGIPHGRV